jgi:hypothetical protein
MIIYKALRPLIPLSRIRLEKLIVTQLVKKYPAFYRTRRFITVFTRGHRVRDAVEAGKKWTAMMLIRNVPKMS